MSAFFRVTILSVLLFVAACSGSEQVAEEPAAVENRLAEEEVMPAWFVEGVPGELHDGLLFGYAAVPGTVAERVYPVADRQAAGNLLYWIDQQLEEARRRAAEVDAAADAPAFIIDLRNAVREVELAADYRNESVERNGVMLGLSRVEADPDALLELLGSRLQNHAAVWERILATNPLGN